MKDKKRFILFIPIIASLFLPVSTFVLYIFGYTVSLKNYSVFSAVFSLIILVSTALILKREKTNYGKSMRFFYALLPLFSLINAFIYVFKSRTLFVAVCMAVCIICSAIICEKICKSDLVKILSVTFSSLLFVLFLIFSASFIFFSSFSENTVKRNIPSPDGAYYAEIIDSDQGALGGDTVVYVHKNSKLDLLILTVSKIPQRVYIGEWREYEAMQIQWKGNSCLLINSKEIHIEI